MRKFYLYFIYQRNVLRVEGPCGRNHKTSICYILVASSE